jgi:DNA-binding MarR family transcriptional regulator
MDDVARDWQDQDLQAANDALRSLILASQQFRQRFADAAAINVIDALALSHLASGEAIPMGELATRIGLGPSGVTSLVDRLEHAGLARREAARPGSRRTVYVALTPRGSDALALGSAWSEQAVLDVGEHQLPELTVLLNALASALGNRAREYDGIKHPAPRLRRD